MLTPPEIQKLINYLKADNEAMSADIKQSGAKMPNMKALFEIQIIENENLIQKILKLNTRNES